MTTTLAIKDLWLDANQGLDASDRAFGYIGTNEPYEDEDGESAEFCGWFFTWPGNAAKITTESERDAVLDSLDLDETAKHRERIPDDMAREKLSAYLAKKFPGNLDASDE